MSGYIRSNLCNIFFGKIPLNFFRFPSPEPDCTRCMRSYVPNSPQWAQILRGAVCIDTPADNTTYGEFSFSFPIFHNERGEQHNFLYIRSFKRSCIRLERKYPDIGGTRIHKNSKISSYPVKYCSSEFPTFLQHSSKRLIP